ncbi:unnamed protein product [Meganyctiphanes norvegica]|uniref:Uncharacterized protein n=1 Tax=Meganyctiphanes norvegica TaxID=48144 RepID=A0AAV2Q3U2_MEGNR
MGCCNRLSTSMNLKTLVYSVGVGQILLSCVTIFLVLFAVCIVDVVTDKAIQGIIADVEPEVGAELMLFHRIIRSAALLYAVFNMVIAAVLLKGNSIAERKVLIPYLVQGSLNISGLLTLFIVMFVISEWLMVGIVAVGTVMQAVFMALVAARFYQLKSKWGACVEEEDTLLAES